MKNVVVFLASSEELLEDRRAVGDLFQFLNNVYTKRGVYLRLETWEYGSAAIVDGRKQDEYNQLIRDSDLCFFLFFTKAGQYTLEEFDAALASFKDLGKPKIVVFVREVPEGTTIDTQLTAFLKRLGQDMGHFWNQYGELDTLKLYMFQQIVLNGADVPYEVTGDRLMVGGRELVDLRNVPSYQGYERIHAAQHELDAIQTRYDDLQAKFDASPDDPVVMQEYGEVASHRQDLLDELAVTRTSFMKFTKSLAQRSSSGERLLPQQIQAYRLFESGHVDQALQILNLETLRQEADRTQARVDAAVQAAIDAARDEMQPYVTANLDYYSMLQSKPVTPQILGEMEQALRAAYEVESRNNLEPVAACELGNFLARQNRFTDALGVFEPLRDNSSFSSDPELRETVLNNLGETYRKLHRYTQSESALYECVNLCRGLAHSDPQTHTIDLAMALNNLGNLYTQTHRDKLAESVYQESVDLLRRLVSVNPEDYTSQLAMVLGNLGVLYSKIIILGHKVDNQPRAEAVCQEAVTYCRDLASNAEVYKPDLARALSSLGMMYWITGRLEQAESVCRESVSLHRELIHDNPEAYTPGLANALCWLGRVSGGDRGVSALQEAVSIYRDLVYGDSESYAPDFSITVLELGKAYIETNRIDQAESALTESVALFQELIKADPQGYSPPLLAAFELLSAVYASQGHLAQAIDICQQAIPLCRQLQQVDSMAYTSMLAATLSQLGSLDVNLGIQNRDPRCFEEAKVACQEAVEVYQDLALSDPVTNNPGLAQALYVLGTTFEAIQDWEGAEPSYRESVTISRDLSNSDPKTYLPDLALALGKLSGVYANLAVKYPEGSFNAWAITSGMEAVSLYRGLIGSNRQTYGPYLAAVLSILGIARTRLGEFEQAISEYRESVSLYREFVETDPDSLNRALDNFLAMGNRYRELGHLDEAESVYKEILSFYREFVTMNPNAFTPGLAQVIGNLGAVYLTGQRFDQAGTMLSEAVAMYRTLCGIDPQTYMPKLAQTLSLVAAAYAATGCFQQAESTITETLTIYSTLSQQNPHTYVEQVGTALQLLLICETQLGHKKEVKELKRRMGLK